MGKAIDLTGQVFGRLTVLYRNGSDKNQRALWHCKCICGNEVDIVSQSLTKGATKSCGCLQKEYLIKKNLESNSIEIGKTYNYLTPIRNLGLKCATKNSQKRRSYYLCKCELCGKEVEITGNDLISGHVKSCGCYNQSYGELEIEKFLQQRNISYVREYKFNDLINKKPLRFDFGIINNNKLLFLIEYDGKQHFKEGCTGWFDGQYEEIHSRDLLKDNYCLTNNIKLVRINYKENLKQRLEEIFNEL